MAMSSYTEHAKSGTSRAILHSSSRTSVSVNGCFINHWPSLGMNFDYPESNKSPMQ